MEDLSFMSGVDADKSTADSSSTVVSPDDKVEALDGDVPTENGNNNIADNDKVSCGTFSVELGSRYLYLFCINTRTSLSEFTMLGWQRLILFPLHFRLRNLKLNLEKLLLCSEKNEKKKTPWLLIMAGLVLIFLFKSNWPRCINHHQFSLSTSGMGWVGHCTTAPVAPSSL